MCSQRRKPNTDRISTLPDSIICHILSYLPTKLSATTTVLSKRWNLLWLSVLTLDFDDQNFTNFATFRHFIYSVILMRDTTLPLQSFRLKCGISPGCDPYDINRLLRVVVKRGIQNLTLDLSHTNHSFQIKLSPTIFSVFNCRNLVVLKLKEIVVYDLPQIDLPLLKTLHFDVVIFFGDFFIKFVKGCTTILEELQTTDFLFRNDGSEGISFPNLVRANISMVSWTMPFAWICNAKFMCVELSKEQRVHTFHNLTHMELIFKSSWRTKWKWLVELLEHCPKLQNLTLHKLYEHGVDEDDWKEPQIVPECISSQLRTCSLIAYKGTKCELQFVEYIIKNAKALHTMTISASPMDIKTKYLMLMKLSLIPRGSTTCKLSFN